MVVFGGWGAHQALAVFLGGELRKLPPMAWNDTGHHGSARPKAKGKENFTKEHIKDRERARKAEGVAPGIVESV